MEILLVIANEFGSRSGAFPKAVWGLSYTYEGRTIDNTRKSIIRQSP
jgi:hypothetical protein